MVSVRMKKLNRRAAEKFNKGEVKIWMLKLKLKFFQNITELDSTKLPSLQKEGKRPLWDVGWL
jgi:hypothetical protein